MARAIRREIPAVMLRIATPGAYSALVENLGEPDSRIRFRIITALNKLSQMNPDWRMDATVVEAVLKRGDCRPVSLVSDDGRAQRHGATPGARSAALEDVIGNETERIFRLLKVLDPDDGSAQRLRRAAVAEPPRARQRARAHGGGAHPALRELLVPLLDGAVSVAARVRAADRITGAPIDDAGRSASCDSPILDDPCCARRRKRPGRVVGGLRRLCALVRP